MSRERSKRASKIHKALVLRRDERVTNREEECKLLEAKLRVDPSEPIDPDDAADEEAMWASDAAEEESMWAADELIDAGLAVDQDPMEYPFESY